MDQKTEARSVEALNSSLVRIAQTKDDKLGKLLEKALPNLLPFLNSPSSRIKATVMQILSHVNSRLVASPEISLPVHKLLVVYHGKDALKNPTLSTSCLFYIEKAFDQIDRMSTKRVNSLVQLILIQLSKRRDSERITRLHIFLTILPKLVLSQEFTQNLRTWENCKRFTSFPRRKKMRRLLLQFLFGAMLLKYPISVTQDKKANIKGPVPGLSVGSWSEVTRSGRLLLSANELVDVKKAVMSFCRVWDFLAGSNYSNFPGRTM
eukprot:TRINITY_DN1601_c0_g1_i2.p1 TRINITY_DN1601_c0_g1~~TRINITY_DN1601_c0_g1_i2.p1  ORF type:complete len:264 (-),score=30.43 TRINITY_DN1601_c0_g1_i2:1396-2187(-)